MANAHLIQTPRPRDRSGRAADLVIAGALIALTLPLMAIVVLAIKCDSRGPIFVGEERVGSRDARSFSAWKFRTEMYDRECDGAVRCVAEEGVTRVGWLLQFTRMDSLPQLINVLRGEMTCINARADLPFFLD